MPTPRSGFATAVVNGVIYAIGGVGQAGFLNTVEAYDPVTDSWTTKAPMPTAREGLAAGVVNGVIYAVGGQTNAGTRWVVLNTVEAYNPATNTWTTMSSMAIARTDLAAGVVDGILYAVGGANPATGLNTVEAFNPATGVWYGCAPMRKGRSGLGVGVVGHRLFAVGGSDISSIFNSSRLTQAYDPATNSWTDRADMPRDHIAFGTAVEGGRLYAIGGANEAAVDAYDPVANRWTTPTRLPTERSGLSAGASGGIIYAIGGQLSAPARELGLNEALDLHVPPSVSQGGAVNGASFRPATDPNGALAPGAIASIFGSDLAQGTAEASDFPLPVNLGGATVLFSGIAVPLFYVSPEQINVQVPFELSPGAVFVEVHRSGMMSPAQIVAIADVSPGVFTLGGGEGAILHGDTFQVVSASNPARPSSIVLIYCTGLGQLEPTIEAGVPAPVPLSQTIARPQVTIAGLPAEVSYSGVAPGFAGLYQVNVRVPPGTPSGTQNLELFINGVPSNAVTIAVHQ